MDRSEWLNRLEMLHDKVRQGVPVGGADLAWYQAARASLLERAMAVQAFSITSDSVRRSSLRVARAAQVLLEAKGWHAQTITLDLGGGGFAVLLETPPPVDDWIRATLVLPVDGTVVTTVTVTDSRPHHGMVRVAFRFSEPTGEARHQVEGFLVDSILEQLVFWDDVMEKLRV